MYCEHCNQETEEGRFCTNCGNELLTDETAATHNPSVEESVLETTTTSNQTQQTNDFSEQLKKISSEFSEFFLQLVKKPSEASHANANQLVSSLIMMGLFSLFISFSYYLALKSDVLGFFLDVSFLNNFIVPFIIFFILFIVIASITFVGLKLSGKNIAYQEILAKYGAYLIPFSLIFVLSILFSFAGVITLTLLTFLISMLGVLLIIPTLIIMGYSSSGFDRVYLLIGVYIVSLLIFGILIQTFLESIIGGMLNNITSFF